MASEENLHVEIRTSTVTLIRTFFFVFKINGRTTLAHPALQAVKIFIDLAVGPL